MCDDWLAPVQVPMAPEHFQLLPRNPAFAYDYRDGLAHLLPRARFYHALLPLEPAPRLEGAADRAALRLPRDGDWPVLAEVFADAFRDLPPFGQLDEPTRVVAARDCLKQTRSGGDGPLIHRACRVAVDGKDQPLAASVVTMFPAEDPSSTGSYHWPEPPPADAVERRLGRPHLTWIFVKHGAEGRGVGTALLQASVDSLREMGFTEMATTFLLGNPSSLLWHWRMGFQLVAYPFSRRR